MPLGVAALLAFGCTAAPGDRAAHPDAPPWTWADVELMGHRSVDRAAILAELGFQAGAPYATDREGWARAARHLEEHFGFAQVHVSAVRFVDRRAYLVVDVVEVGEEHRGRFRPAPAGAEPPIDAEVLTLFERLGELRALGFEQGSPASELADDGFLDFDDPALHAIALELRRVVPAHREALIGILHRDADREKRSDAATLLNWGGEVADSIARVHVCADDPDVGVRNNVTRFLLHYLGRVESAEVRRALIEQLARQLGRPSHADRNKAVYGLLHLVESWPEDARVVRHLAGAGLHELADRSILSNVGDPARQLLEILAQRRVQAPPAELGLDPFYAKYVEASGYPIVASAAVNDFALLEAAYLVDLLLARRPDVREAMIASGSRLIVMGYNEFTTDMPEYREMTPKDYWDRRARGLGGSRTDPVCSCAEENVLAFPGDPYHAENIVIHEFAHNIHLRGMVNVDPTFDERVKAAYVAAVEGGLWRGKYASTNHHEYFAEGVQSWFDDNREDDHDHNHVNTRAELIAYDPGLADLCREVFGDTELAYTKPTTRLTGHLEGYDPSTAPTFEWPAHLREVGRKIREDAEKRE